MIPLHTWQIAQMSTIKVGDILLDAQDIKLIVKAINNYYIHVLEPNGGLGLIEDYKLIKYRVLG